MSTDQADDARPSTELVSGLLVRDVRSGFCQLVQKLPRCKVRMNPVHMIASRQKLVTAKPRLGDVLSALGTLLLLLLSSIGVTTSILRSILAISTRTTSLVALLSHGVGVLSNVSALTSILLLAGIG